MYLRMKYGNKCIFDVSFKEKEEQKVYRFWSIFLNRLKCDVVRMNYYHYLQHLHIVEISQQTLQ
jgi:hypothetical protein